MMEIKLEYEIVVITYIPIGFVYGFFTLFSLKLTEKKQTLFICIKFKYYRS